MARYAEIADVERAIGVDTLRAIADHNGDGIADNAVIEAALDDASALADTYLDDVQPLPSPPPAALRRAVITIATHYMRSPRALNTEDSREDYKQTIKWLEAIAAGKATLVPQPDVPTTPDAYVDPGDPEADGLGRVWSRESARRVF